MKRDTFELIQALEGSIAPYAETHVDEKHLANLKEWCELHERITDEIAKVAELESKHWNECRQIAHYSDENAKLKELLRKAVEVINREISSFTTCEECNMYDEETTECNGNAMDKCSEIGKWRYADEALALIGEDGDTNG